MKRKKLLKQGACIAVCSTMPVSYTHLDVYKRQVLKVVHEDDEVEEELSTIVDAGGHVKDVFVYHKVYGVIRANNLFFLISYFLIY